MGKCHKTVWFDTAYDCFETYFRQPPPHVIDLEMPWGVLMSSRRWEKLQLKMYWAAQAKKFLGFAFRWSGIETLSGAHTHVSENASLPLCKWKPFEYLGWHWIIWYSCSLFSNNVLLHIMPKLHWDWRTHWGHPPPLLSTTVLLRYLSFCTQNYIFSSWHWLEISTILHAFYFV